MKKIKFKSKTKNKASTKKLSFKKRNGLIPVLFVIGFAVIGIMMLVNSSAFVPSLKLNDGEFTALDPARIHDGQINEGQTIPIQINGAGGVPASNVRAVVVNITVANPTKAGFMTVYPSGTVQPSASTINFLPTTGAVANQITVPVGGDGKINVYNVFGSARFILDTAGYFTDQSGASGARFVPTDPTRIFDSTVTQNSVTPLQIRGNGGVPASTQVSAVVINITAAAPTQDGFLSAYPSGNSIPLASSINFKGGIGAVANQITVKIGADGKINVFNPLGNVRLIADVAGYYTVDGNRFVGVNPTRIHDTTFSENQTKSVKVTGIAGVPQSHVRAVIVNVTVASPTKPGFVTVYPNGNAVPTASSVNFTPQTGAIANQIVAKVGKDGKINILNVLGQARVILDISGYFMNNDQLEVIEYDSNKIMPFAYNRNVQLIQDNVSYGPSPAQHFDVYETSNRQWLTASNRDTIVWFFGGGWEGGNNSLATPYDNIAKHLAAQYGYKLVAASYRLSGEAPYPAQYQDAVAIVKHLKANAAVLDIDPNRIILGGFSAGGDLATMAGHGYDVPAFQPTFVSPLVGQQSAKVNRIISFATPFSKVSWASKFFPGSSPIPALNKLIGQPGTIANMTEYTKLEALQYASSDDPPHYTVMSKSDEVIPYDSQFSAIQQIGLKTSTIFQYGGPNRHASGLDTNVSALLEFLK